MSEKLKSFLLNDHIFFGLVIILVGISSFGLGRASVSAEVEKTSELRFLDQKALVRQASTSFQVNDLRLPPIVESSVVEEIVASKSGTKYHLTTCGGAKQIKPENKIFFSSRVSAEAAGYKPAANCLGLQ